MNQKLSDWASIAEIVSGAAVVVTLVFLVSGIRDNAAVTRASMYDRNMDALISVRDRIASDPELARIWQIYGSQQSLDEVLGPQRMQLSLLIVNLFGVYEKAYFSRQYGVIGDSEWTRFAENICIQWERPPADIRETLLRTLTDEFAEHIATLCSDEFP